MKKIICLLIVILTLSGCNTNKPKYTYDIVSRNVDMSAYDNVSATDHMFKAITVQELFNCIDNKSSGVFYLGRENCMCCQTCVQYLNKVAKKENVTIYYIDVYDEYMPLTDKDLYNKLEFYLYDILDTIDGKKELQTPTIFSVVNGKLTDSLICLSNWDWDDNPTQEQIDKLENKYLEIIKPFLN